MIDFKQMTYLKDGTKILLRFLKPDDRDALQSGLKRLSQKSRYFRFISPINRFSNCQLNYLTNIDYLNHLAIGAGDLSKGEHYGIGIARYIRLKHEPEIAEIAITVVDKYQNKGLGKILFEKLVYFARKNNILKFRNFVHMENIPMLKILERFDAKFKRQNNYLLLADINISKKIAISYC